MKQFADYCYVEQWGLHGDQFQIEDVRHDGVAVLGVYRPRNNTSCFYPLPGQCPTGSATHFQDCEAK